MISAPATVAARPVTTARVALACGVALTATVIVAVVAAHHASPSDVSPVVPSGRWNDAWIAALVAAFCLYGLAALAAWNGALKLRLALVVAVGVQAIPLAAPLLLSKDAYLYWGEGRVLAVHHANPYVSTPADFPRDPATPWVSESWRAEPAPYGPAWEVVGAAPALASSHRGAELGYRMLAVVTLLGALALVAWRTRNAAAVVFLGWSPLVALHYGAGGHSDSTMMLFVLAALTAGATLRGGVFWPLAAAFKPFPPVLVPLELARRRLDVGRRWWLGLVGGTVAVAAVSTGLFGTHWISAATTGAHQTSPLGGVHWLTQAGLTHRNAVAACALVFVAVYLILLWNAWRTGRGRFSLAATALCLTSSLLRPWYALWPVALAALEEDAVAAVAAFALTGYLLFGDAVQL